MNWNIINSPSHLEEIKKESKGKKVLIFKHSTRCNISRTALDRLERNWKDEDMNHIKPYYLDLLSYRQISQKIAEDFAIEHESPQVIIIENEKPIYDRSHFDIDYNKIKESFKN